MIRGHPQGEKRMNGGDMEAVIRHLANLKFEAVARGHKIVCDQPPENGGSDAGMTPPEFLLVSLGTCAAYYAAQYLRTRGLKTDQLTVRVSGEKATQPARLASFVIDVEMPDLDSRHCAGLKRAVKSCLIHNTLCHPPAIDLHVHTTAPALA
jgi:putative redox protein